MTSRPPPSLVDGVRDAFEGEVEPSLLEALVAVAAGTQGRLLSEGGSPLHVLVDAIARSLGFPDARRCDLRAVIDLLQVMIDLCDDLADVEVDRRAGREVARHLEETPLAVLQCLPSLLAMRATALLYDSFPPPAYAAAGAVARLRQTLGRMALGQGYADASAEKIARVSGDQGRLLCLPYWLSAEALAAQRLAEVEKWSYVYGVTWELRAQARDARSAAARFALARSVAAARAAWPRFSPFRQGEDLAWEALLPPDLATSAR